MKILTRPSIPSLRRSTSDRLLACLALSGCWCILATTPASAEPNDPSDLVAHEWGTFTTFHGPSGVSIPWYQPGSPRVSELPGFVHPKISLLGKSRMRVTARMETPVIYFYTASRRVVDVSVAYPEGTITEYFPKMDLEVGGWPGLELIPPGEAGDLALPLDPQRPDNHYFAARAVPEAALVRRPGLAEETGEKSADELEKFLFYRGAGKLHSNLLTWIDENEITLSWSAPAEPLEHVWVLQSSSETVGWKKIPAMLPFESSTEGSQFPERTVVPYASLDEHSSRDQSVAALRVSMQEALTEAGLTPAEAAAMVATWGDHWFEEPGCRVFSILPRTHVDEQLPLSLSPRPRELARVFVHRAELLGKETLQMLETSMAPDTAPEMAASLVREAGLGRFIHGAMEFAADEVGRRTALEYRNRGWQAIEADRTSIEVSQRNP